MSLTPGARLAPYEITGAIGAGGARPRLDGYNADPNTDEASD
jgi:hypothetical protein